MVPQAISHHSIKYFPIDDDELSLRYDRGLTEEERYSYLDKRDIMMAERIMALTYQYPGTNVFFRCGASHMHGIGERLLAARHRVMFIEHLTTARVRCEQYDPPKIKISELKTKYSNVEYFVYDESPNQ